jgi:hypothetical protein
VFLYLPLPYRAVETSTPGFTLASVSGEEASRGEVSSSLVRLVAVPKMEKAIEDSPVQPLAHLASSTVRTFELVYSEGKTDLLLSAETVEDMKKYVSLLSLVYGGLKLSKADRTLPSCETWLRSSVRLVRHFSVSSAT